MRKERTLKKILAWICLGALLLSLPFFPALAYENTTLHNGSRGDDVKELQQALIDLGFLKGTADGVFGNNTENAVRAFQKKFKLDVDGLAGKKTREMILQKAEEKNKPKATKTPKPAATPTPQATAQPTGHIFSGNYNTSRSGDQGKRVTLLQNAQISL